jgi:hypothetical protein
LRSLFSEIPLRKEIETADTAIRIREFDRLSYKDPADYLKRLRAAERLLPAGHLRYEVRSLRTRRLRLDKERREAALLCYGVKQVMGYEAMGFASYPTADHDAVFRRREENTILYTPVQLKEVVPLRLNSKASIEAELAKLTKYSNATDLVVGVFFNQIGDYDFSSLNVPKIDVAQIWVFGCCSLDQNEWYLHGDLLSDARLSKFRYPE